MKEIKLSIPTKDCTNGRVYSNDVIEKFIEKVNNENVYGKVGDEYGIGLDEISHKVKSAEHSGEFLNVTLEVLDTTKGKMLSDMLDNNYEMAPSVLIESESSDKGLNIVSIKSINVVWNQQ